MRTSAGTDAQEHRRESGTREHGQISLPNHTNNPFNPFSSTLLLKFILEVLILAPKVDPNINENNARAITCFARIQSLLERYDKHSEFHNSLQTITNEVAVKICRHAAFNFVLYCFYLFALIYLLIDRLID